MWSAYDGTEFESLLESDIEHIVAISEAHDSGLCAAPGIVRQRFARDLDNLTLATPRLNRHEKASDDAAEWLPDQNWCWFAARIVAVRQEYPLTIDQEDGYFQATHESGWKCRSGMLTRASLTNVNCCAPAPTPSHSAFS